MNRDGFEGLYVYPSLEAQTVDCGGHALLREIEALLAPFSTGSEEWQAFAATLYGQSEILKMDGEGRIMMSDTIKTHVGIGSEVTFVGMGPKFQIWEPGRFRAYLAEAKDRVRDARKQFGTRTPTNEARLSAGARE